MSRIVVPAISFASAVFASVVPAHERAILTNEVIFGSDFESLPATGTGSVYVQLGSDRFVSGTPERLLAKTTWVPNDGWAYIESDGRYYSSVMPTGRLARAWIEVDGTRVSNDSTIDWTGGTHVSQHCLNAIAAVYLSRGYHDVSLVADGQSFYAGAGTNLSLVAGVAANVEVSTLPADAGPYSFSLPSGGLPDGSIVPSQAVLSHMASAAPGEAIVSLASFSETNAGRYGDALATIYRDGVQPTLSEAVWTDNDGYDAIELRAPMYAYAYFDASASHVISLNASLYPWSVNGQADDVTYRVDKSAKLISLAGGMTLFGKAESLWNAPQGESRFGSFWCIGSNQSWPGCPQTGSDVKLASATVLVPPTHHGEVFFTSKIRMQGDKTDSGGNVFLYLTIDGQPTGSYGVQGITAFDGESQRTLTTSYFSAGSRHLEPGTHVIDVWTKATGTFIHMTASADLPLIYFD